MRNTSKQCSESIGVMPKINPQVIPSAIETLPVSELSSLKKAKICLRINPIVTPDQNLLSYFRGEFKF